VVLVDAITNSNRAGFGIDECGQGSSVAERFPMVLRAMDYRDRPLVHRRTPPAAPSMSSPTLPLTALTIVAGIRGAVIVTINDGFLLS
jgi:hypothetical protein